MGVSKKPESKVVIKNAAGSFLDVRIVHHHEGHGKNRRVKTSEYGIFNTKHRVSSEKFNKPELAVEFIKNNIHKYDKRRKTFK